MWRGLIVAGLGVLIVAGGVSAQGQDESGRAPVGLSGAKRPMGAEERLKLDAIELEARMELAEAKLRWEFLRRMRRSDPEPAIRIDVLSRQIALMAGSHFRNGTDLFKAKKYDSARREFLLALSYDPGHAAALDYVKKRLKRFQHPDWVYYTVVEGDTLQGVADKAYSDSKKDFIVAAFNSLSDTAKLEPGMVLQLPIIESDLRKPSVRVGDVLSQAKKFLDQAQYDHAVDAADSIIVYDPGNAAARDIINAAYYQQGKALSDANDFKAALDVFRNVDAGYRDVQESIAAIRSRLRAQAEDHYKKGVGFFINEDLDNAIREWETTLNFDPQHQKARDDLANARNLRERLEQVR